jgi:hypothetical protein
LRKERGCVRLAQALRQFLRHATPLIDQFQPNDPLKSLDDLVRLNQWTGQAMDLTGIAAFDQKMDRIQSIQSKVILALKNEIKQDNPSSARIGIQGLKDLEALEPWVLEELGGMRRRLTKTFEKLNQLSKPHDVEDAMHQPIGAVTDGIVRLYQCHELVPFPELLPQVWNAIATVFLTHLNSAVPRPAPWTIVQETWVQSYPKMLDSVIHLIQTIDPMVSNAPTGWTQPYVALYQALLPMETHWKQYTRYTVLEAVHSVIPPAGRPAAQPITPTSMASLGEVLSSYIVPVKANAHLLFILSEVIASACEHIAARFASSLNPTEGGADLSQFPTSGTSSVAHISHVAGSNALYSMYDKFLSELDDVEDDEPIRPLLAALDRIFYLVASAMDRLRSGIEKYITTGFPSQLGHVKEWFNQVNLRFKMVHGALRRLNCGPEFQKQFHMMMTRFLEIWSIYLSLEKECTASLITQVESYWDEPLPKSFLALKELLSLNEEASWHAWENVDPVVPYLRALTVQTPIVLIHPLLQLCGGDLSKAVNWVQETDSQELKSIFIKEHSWLEGKFSPKKAGD